MAADMDDFKFGDFNPSFLEGEHNWDQQSFSRNRTSNRRAAGASTRDHYTPNLDKRLVVKHALILRSTAQKRPFATSPVQKLAGSWQIVGPDDTAENLEYYTYKVWPLEDYPTMRPPKSVADGLHRSQGLINLFPIAIPSPSFRGPKLPAGQIVDYHYENPSSGRVLVIDGVSENQLLLKGGKIDGSWKNQLAPWGAPLAPGGPTTCGPTSSGRINFTFGELKKFRGPLQELMGWIAAHEGNYESVNRGKAGDSPGGAFDYVGKKLTELSIRELLSYMKGGIKAIKTGKGGSTSAVPGGSVGFLAVGKYQFIPKTLRWAVKVTKVSHSAKFDEETQEILGLSLLLMKRQKLGKYLVGISTNSCAAGQEAALEWASLPVQIMFRQCPRGFGAYCTGGANGAGKKRRTPEMVIQKLEAARQKVSQSQEAKQLIADKGHQPTFA